jgi:hypothetical protein
MRKGNLVFQAAGALVALGALIASPASSFGQGGPPPVPPPDTASLLSSAPAVGGSEPHPGILPPPVPPAPDTASLLVPGVTHPAEMPEERFTGCTFFASGEYLLLQPRRRALDFAISSATNDGTPQGSVQSLGFQSNSGIRVGGGVVLPNCGWEFGGYYTYFHSADRNAFGAPPGGALYATLTHPGFVSQVDTAAAGANLDYQIFDLEAVHPYKLSDNTTLRVLVGGRFAWIDQRLSAFYNGQSAFQADVLSPISFYGAGIRAGAEGDWKICRRFGVYAHGAGSLLAGDFRTTLLETNNANTTTIVNVTDNYHKIVPVAELGLGVSWQCEHVLVRIGYEVVNWFGLVDSPDFVHDFSNKLSHRTSDLGLDGLSVKVQWTY